MVQTVDIVESLLQDLKRDLGVKSVEDLGSDQYKLIVCNTLWLNTYYEWEIDEGVIAKVIEFKFNEYVIIEVVGFVPTSGIYKLPLPFYNHGTIRAVNAERDEIPYSAGKYPYVFLLERMTERFNTNEEDITDRISPLRMFFLTNYNENDWQTDQHYKEIIEPMSNLRKNFITLLKYSKLVNDEITFDTEWEGTNYVRFGTYREDSGNINSLMDEDVSGVGLEIDVVFLKDLTCKLVCNC